MVDATDDGPGLAGDLRIASAAAARVEHTCAGERIAGHAGFGLEGGAILVIVGHFVGVPLPTKTRQVLLFDEPGNAADDRKARAAAAEERIQLG